MSQETKALALLLGKARKMKIPLESTKEDRKHEVREKEENLGNVTFAPDSGVDRFRLTFLWQRGFGFSELNSIVYRQVWW